MKSRLSSVASCATSRAVPLMQLSCPGDSKSRCVSAAIFLMCKCFVGGGMKEVTDVGLSHICSFVLTRVCFLFSFFVGGRGRGSGNLGGAGDRCRHGAVLIIKMSFLSALLWGGRRGTSCGTV